MATIKLTPTSIVIYSLSEIMEAVPWSHEDKFEFFKKLSRDHSWGDTALACITLEDFHNIVDYCELEAHELIVAFDDTLIQLDWNEPES